GARQRCVELAHAGWWRVDSGRDVLGRTAAAEGHGGCAAGGGGASRGVSGSGIGSITASTYREFFPVTRVGLRQSSENQKRFVLLRRASHFLLSRQEKVTTAPQERRERRSRPEGRRAGCPE